jgi:hypothetical protein
MLIVVRWLPNKSSFLRFGGMNYKLNFYNLLSPISISSRHWGSSFNSKFCISLSDTFNLYKLANFLKSGCFSLLPFNISSFISPIFYRPVMSVILLSLRFRSCVLRHIWSQLGRTSILIYSAKTNWIWLRLSATPLALLEVLFSSMNLFMIFNFYLLELNWRDWFLFFNVLTILSLSIFYWHF